jgi:hypothetical protein
MFKSLIRKDTKYRSELKYRHMDGKINTTESADVKMAN